MANNVMSGSLTTSSYVSMVPKPVITIDSDDNIKIKADGHLTIEDDDYRLGDEKYDYGRFDLPDFWEHNCTEFNYHYIWICHAIVWGIQQYNMQKKQKPTPPAGRVIRECDPGWMMQREV